LSSGGVTGLSSLELCRKQRPCNNVKAVLKGGLVVIETGSDKSSTSHLIFRLWSSGERDTLMVKPLNVVKFHNFVIIFSPPPLCLPFVEHLTAVVHHSMQQRSHVMMNYRCKIIIGKVQHAYSYHEMQTYIYSTNIALFRSYLEQETALSNYMKGRTKMSFMYIIIE
jgi:hypothetical protein